MRWTNCDRINQPVSPISNQLHEFRRLKQRRCRRGSTAKHLELNELNGIQLGVNPRGVFTKKHHKRDASLPEDSKVAGAAPHSPANTDVGINLTTFLVDQINKTPSPKIATPNPVLKSSKFNISFVF